jgi:glyoxylase-like metal-dependent hydrolase (beta-lactamase superfamily II)
MRKKIVIICLSVAGFLIVCVAGIAAWFFYQMRDMHTLETARISDTVFVLKGSISNMYLIKSTDGFVAFDASDNAKKIAVGFKELSIDPSLVKAVFLTHSDGDHVGALPVFPSAKVYLSKEEIPLLKDKKHRHFMGMEHMNTLPVSTYETLSEGDSVDVGGVVVHAIATPGHTLGSMCYRFGTALFTGDLCMVVNDKVQPMIKLFTEDMSVDSASIRKVAGLSGINEMYTAHTGFVKNSKEALEMWR